MTADKGATDFTQGSAADASALTVVGEYKAALGPGPETGPVNRESGFRAINWDPAAASNLGVTQNSAENAIFPVSGTRAPAACASTLDACTPPHPPSRPISCG